MEIIFYVALWLLSGFLAAWLGHIVIDNRKTDLPNEILVAMLLLGPCGLTPILFFGFIRLFTNFPTIFKAKEPK